MAWWEPLALLGIALGVSMVLVAIVWHWAPWWMARRACRQIDTEWAHHDEWFGSDGAVDIVKARVSLGLAVAWGVFTVVAMFLPIRDSVALIFLMSGYAIVVAHLAEWAGHRSEEQTGDKLDAVLAQMDQ